MKRCGNLYIVYQTTNKINDKIYIGCHKVDKDNIEDGYLGSGKLLVEDIKKYGKENFAREVLASSDSFENMALLEHKLVTKEFVKREDTYNIRPGGGSDLGSAGFRNNIQQLEKGRKKLNRLLKNPEWKSWFKERCTEGQRLVAFKRIGNKHFLGKKHTEETKRIISVKAKIHAKGTRNSQYGTHWIYSLELKQNKKIKKEELEQYLKEGWIKGRKMKF